MSIILNDRVNFFLYIYIVILHSPSYLGYNGVDSLTFNCILYPCVPMELRNGLMLFQIYEVQPVVSKAFQTSEMIPLPRLLSMVLVTSLPPVCNKVFFTQGLNVSDRFS